MAVVGSSFSTGCILLCSTEGFELALACDIIIATPNTRFALSEPAVGLAVCNVTSFDSFFLVVIVNRHSEVVSVDYHA